MPFFRSMSIIFALMLAAAPVFAAETAQYGVKIISSNAGFIEVEYTPHLRGWEKVSLENGQEAFIPDIPGTRLEKFEPGIPGNLIRTEVITVPSPHGFKTGEIRISRKRPYGKLLAPVPYLKNENDLVNEIYSIDKEKYSASDAAEFVTVEYSGISRSRYLAKIKFKAAYYDHTGGKTIIPEKIYVKINFTENPVRGNVSDKYDPEISLNHTLTKNWRIPLKSANKIKQKESVLPALLQGDDHLKITIKEEGIYKLSASTLSSAGTSIPASQVNSIKIFGSNGKHLPESIIAGMSSDLNELPVIVRTKANGELDHIIFYAKGTTGFEYNDGEFQHYINHYSNENYYILTWGGEPGRRAEAISNPDSGDPNIPLSYMERIFEEEEIFNAYVPGGGRNWFGGSIFPQNYRNRLYNLDRSGTVVYRYSLAHRADYPGTFSVKENGNEMKDINLYGLLHRSYTNAYKGDAKAELPASNIAPDDFSELSFEYFNEQSGSAATPFMNYYEIHYPRSFVAVNNEIEFHSDPGMEGVTKYTINEFSGNEIIGFEVTDEENPKLLENAAKTGGMFIFKTELTPGLPKRFHIASEFKNPAAVESIKWKNLRQDPGKIDMIIVTARELMNSAEQYAEYRSQQAGLNIEIAAVEDIYNEFGYGLPDPTAIRNYLSYAYHNWDTSPFYVLLWGDGHYDFKNLQAKTKNYVPPYESYETSDTFDATKMYTSDDYFVKVSGEDRTIDMAVGRITIDSDPEGQWMLEKIRHYENNSEDDMWRTTVTLVADDSWTTSPPYDGNTHTEDSESLAATFLPDDIQISKLYLPEYQTENIPGGKRKPGVNEDILSSANLSGTLLMNWYGHGNPQVWAHEHVLNRETDITKMINLDKLFFLTAGTCDYARFDMTENQSGAEDMLLSRSGGAIGVFSSSRLVYASSNSLITQEFYHQLFTRDTESGLYPTVGEVLFRVKQRYNALNDVKFFVLGDPSIRLLIPDHRAEITIDSVDGKPVDNKAEEIQIKALSKVSLSCVIKDRSIDQIVSDFNGKAFMTMLDGDDEITVEDFDGSMHYILKHGGALNRSSYDVRSGRFSAEITVPRDISFSGNSGRLYVYAYAEDGRQAKGGIRSYEVNGINPNANPDDKGPEINIFMDARSFRQGEIVSEEPLLIVDLRDSTGLNTTGRGIGHGIEAWLNDDPQSIDLTEYFTTSPEDPKSGTVRRKLSKLEPGLYTVKVRAWDIFNNYSVAETYFRVAPENDIVISDIRNYPNPFDNATTIRFRHNIAPPFEAQLKIYTTTGQMVRVLNSDIFTYHEGEIFWDGFDSYGNKVSQGMYFYNVMIRTANGNTANKSAAASFIR